MKQRKGKYCQYCWSCQRPKLMILQSDGWWHKTCIVAKKRVDLFRSYKKTDEYFGGYSLSGNVSYQKQQGYQDFRELIRRLDEETALDLVQTNYSQDECLIA